MLHSVNISQCLISLQFFQEKNQRVLITSEDSRFCILEGINVVHKYRGKVLLLEVQFIIKTVIEWLSDFDF